MIEIKVDASTALARLSPAGIPQAVRNNLRRVLPGLTRQLGAAVERNLDSGLKSRTTLEEKTELVENPTSIYGRVRTVANAPSPAMLPQWLETGTRPHEIAPRNKSAVAFLWERIGMNAVFKHIQHPGFPGIRYTQSAFDQMRDQIVAEIGEAVREGARGA